MVPIVAMPKRQVRTAPSSDTAPSAPPETREKRKRDRGGATRTTSPEARQHPARRSTMVAPKQSNSLDTLTAIGPTPRAAQALLKIAGDAAYSLGSAAAAA